MNKKILILGFVFLIGLMSVNAYQYNFTSSYFNNCYQETATTAVDCGGVSTGAYQVTTNYFYINYTLPYNFINYNTTWKTKHGLLNPYFSKIPDECIYNNSVRLRFYSDCSGGLTKIGESYGECYYNNNTWNRITLDSVLVGDNAGCGSASGGSNTYLYDGDFNTLRVYSSGSWTNELTLNPTQEITYAVIYEEGINWTGNISYNKTINYSLSAPDVASGDVKVISINLSKSTNQSYNSAVLVYNGVVYSSPVLIDYGTLVSYTQTIINNTFGNFSYYWNISLNDYGNTFNFTTVNGSQLVSGLTANLTFIDSATNTIMNAKNVSFKIIGTIQNNYSTTTGNYNLTNLSSGTYTIISNSQNYLQNDYIFSIDSSTNNPNINIYLTPNSTQTYYILFTVIDKLSRQPLQGAVVTIQHYINNAWVTEQIYTTDFNGRGQGYFILNTDYYNFVITYQGIVYSGVLNSDTNKKIMFYQDYVDGLGIEINTAQTNYINTVQSINSAQTGLKYVSVTNNSGNFIYNFLDTLGQNRNWTLMVYNGNNLNCSTSVYTSSGNLACLITNNGSEQWFQAYTFIDGIPDKTISQRIGVNDAWDFDWGIGGWIFTIFVVIIAFTSFAQVPSISIMIGSVFFALALFFNVIFTQSANVSQLGIVIVFIAFLLAKIPSNSGVNS